MGIKKSFKSIALLIMLGFAFACFSNPTLPIGIWTDITPSYLKGTTFETCSMNFDPTNRSTLYLTGSFGSLLGLIKSTDGGANWARVGTPPSSPNWGDTVNYLDAPFQVAVDPANANHIIATEMSPGGGVTVGFWVTTNGGAQWVRPKGFMDAITASNGCTDAGHFDIDPTDFNHILVTFHSAWNGQGPSGVFETKDCGKTFTFHNPGAGMATFSKGVFFLYDPAHGRTDLNTWLLVEDSDGMWRTTNGGNSWVKVNSGYTPHGGTSTHVYTSTGTLYVPGPQYLYRSADNGITWESISSTATHAYYAIATNGTTIYSSWTGAIPSGASAWMTSPGTDGNSWTPYTAGPSPTYGADDMHYDAVNNIMYSANDYSGIWALKLAGQTGVATKSITRASAFAPAKSFLQVSKTGIAVQTISGRVCDVKGRNIRTR